jgi:hypothetical protein
MATLILTAVGTAVAGPLGGAIGAIAGQQIDSRLFAPKARQGPRLGELAVQTSSYGSSIPKIFGTMRVAGTVIWSTDLIEDRTKSGGGKGRPKTVTYSYSASFAVALSGRRIRGVGRIWADGKLLRGATGDFKSETGYRLYPGSEDQAVDPRIASVEGVNNAPAHRGLAYAMFEDFQLADYGNRIPSLTFEVFADHGSVTIGSIAEELSDGEVVAGETPELAGYAASGDSVRGAMEALAEVVPLSLVEEGGKLRLKAAAEPAVPVAREEAGAHGSTGSGGRSEIARSAALNIPAEVTIAYHDVARDYQLGLQRATRGGSGLNADRVALPAALPAGVAKAMAEQRLRQLWTARETAKLHLPWRRGGIRPGDHLHLEGRGGLWKVSRWSLDRMVVTLELVRVPSGGMPAPAGASAGRTIAQPDQLHGPTTMFLFELPAGGESLAGGPQIVGAAAGVEAGWRSATLSSSFDGGVSWEREGQTPDAAVIGTAITALPPGDSALIDARSSVEVQLLNDAMWLEGRSDAALVAGANMAMVGEELIQFGSVEPLGQRKFRLSRLLRGRRGSEWAAMEHAVGEPFLLIELEKLFGVELPAGMTGGEAMLMAQGMGDGAAGAVGSRVIDGRALQPPSPVHLTAERGAGGDISINWVRRSRIGWSWLSEADAPLGEEGERYRLLLSGAGFERVVDLGTSSYVYSAGLQAEDGLAGPLNIRVVQVGTRARSRAAEIIVG